MRIIRRLMPAIVAPFSRLLYTLVVISLLPWALLHLVWRARRQPDYLLHWSERFGFFSKPAPSSQRTVSAEMPVIWLHAVSVGETHAARSLVSALQAEYPTHRILFTHMTPTGRATSEAVFGNSVDRVYLPYDTPDAMRRFLQNFRPYLGVIMETELWPNMIAACRCEKVPLLLANARLSERSAKRYAWFPALSRAALGGLTAIAAQSVADAQRLEALGAKAPLITGNMKFDIEPPQAQLALAEDFRQRFGQRPVWLAASTREGEEALILEAWKTCALAYNSLLVIVPRHPQRFDEVTQLAADLGYSVERRSEMKAVATTTQILIGDSMGEMFAWYAAVDLAFIGGSLLDFGSQNLIEACAVGTPVLIGPHTRNFAEVSREAIACGAANTIGDAAQLVATVVTLLGQAEQRQHMGNAGRRFTALHRGATQRTMQLIRRIFTKDRP